MTEEKAAATANLEELKQFMTLDRAACADILRLRPIVEREMSAVLDAFYGKVRATPRLSAFFRDDTHMAAAKAAQLKHWDAIGSGRFDDRYAAGVRAIGLAHARVGLEPAWYIAGYAVVVDRLVKAIVSELWPTGLLHRGGRKPADEAGAAIGALVKAALLDVAFAISVYVEAAETARVAAAEEAKAEERARVANSIGAGLAQLADNDLTCRMQDDLPEAYSKLKSDFDGAIARLGETFGGVKSAAEAVHSSAQEITAASNDLARRTEQQASSLEETSAALGQVTTAVGDNAEGAKRARAVVATTRDDAELGAGIVRRGRGDEQDREIVAADQPDYRRHRRDRFPDQPARAQCRDRSGPRRRSRPRLRGRRFRSARAGAAFGRGGQEDQDADLDFERASRRRRRTGGRDRRGARPDRGEGLANQRSRRSNGFERRGTVDQPSADRGSGQSHGPGDPTERRDVGTGERRQPVAGDGERATGAPRRAIQGAAQRRRTAPSTRIENRRRRICVCGANESLIPPPRTNGQHFNGTLCNRAAAFIERIIEANGLINACQPLSRISSEFFN